MRSLRIAMGSAFVSILALTVSCTDLHTSDEEQLVKDVKQIDDYLAAANISAYKDVSGIRFSITSLGTAGLPPSPEQQVTVKYKGKLLDGTVFEESTTTNFVGAYIGGWQRGLPLLPKGTKATLYIPSGLGYGATATGSIPANSILVFDVEMKNVIIGAAEKQRAASDVAAIDKYLADHSITAIADTTGVRYQITQAGSGPKPTWYSQVKFKYSSKQLSTEEQFLSGTAGPSDVTDSRVVNYTNGIKVALTKLAVGGKGTFYLPSGMALGANSSNIGGIPPNANLVYEIELLEIIQ